MPVETKAQKSVYQNQNDPSTRVEQTLLYFYRCAGIDELLLNGCGFVLAHALFDGLGRSIDQVLGFLQPETGDFAYSLDYVDLVCARRSENDRKLRLLLGRWSRRRAATAARCHHRRCRRR